MDCTLKRQQQRFVGAPRCQASVVVPPNVEVPPDIPTFGQPPAIYRHFQDQVPPNIGGGGGVPAMFSPLSIFASKTAHLPNPDEGEAREVHY